MYIEISAGGVVYSKIKNQIKVALLKTQYASGEAWVLPKGKVEDKEHRRDAALREAREELGIQGLMMEKELGMTSFKFTDRYTKRKGELVEKRVYYYLIQASHVKLHPQKKERFLEAAWFTIPEALKRLKFKGDREILRKVRIR